MYKEKNTLSQILFVNGGQAEFIPSNKAKISSTIKALLTMLRLDETEQITGHPGAWRYIGTEMVAVIKPVCVCKVSKYDSKHTGNRQSE